MASSASNVNNAKLYGQDGKIAEVGKSLGYWLEPKDFVSTLSTREAAEGSADLPQLDGNLAKLGFPRRWPEVYTSSKELKSLIGKNGRCRGKKVAVVAAPTEQETAEVMQNSAHQLLKLHSFLNAERVAQDCPEKTTTVVKGWVVYEHIDRDVNEGFVAEKYWWNSKVDAEGNPRWVDYTPRPQAWQEGLLLVEAADELQADKQLTELTKEHEEIANKLWNIRFPAQLTQEAGSGEKLVSTSQANKSSEEKQKEYKYKVQKEECVRSLQALEEKVKGNEEECIKLAKGLSEEECREFEEKRDGKVASKASTTGEGKGQPTGEDKKGQKAQEYPFAKALVNMLRAKDKEKQVAALKMLLLLTDAAVGQKNVEIGSSIISFNVVPCLVQFMTKGIPNNTEESLMVKEYAAAVLGNVCHESPSNQERVAKENVFKPLVGLLGPDNPISVAREAAYAIWNLTVGHEENSAKIVGLDGVPRLTELLKSSCDVAQENAAGALMHVTMSAEARAAIVQADAIPRLCELLHPTYEPDVSTQAAGALLNLASDSPDYAMMIYRAGGVKPLVLQITDGPELAKEYAAGALMNLIRPKEPGDKEAAEVAKQAFDAGAVPALAGMLSRISGHSEALGALANLASGSPERQKAIYKAQVTRKTVKFLTDANVDVKRSAAALIMNMAPQAQIKEKIVEAGALVPLIDLLRDPDLQVRERAAGALANLLNDSPVNVVKVWTADRERDGHDKDKSRRLIPDLVAMLAPSDSKLSLEAKRQAAHALAMLAAEDQPCEDVLDHLNKEGEGGSEGKEHLVQLLKEGVPEAALCVMNLCWRLPEVKEEFARLEAIPELVKMLSADKDRMGREYAAGALMNMTAALPENAERTAAKENAVASLVDLLQVVEEDGRQGAEWSAGALANILRGEGKANENARKKAIEKHAPRKLVELLLPKEATDSGRPLVVLALTSLADHNPDVVLEAFGGDRHKLEEIRDEGNKELKDYCETLLGKFKP